MTDRNVSRPDARQRILDTAGRLFYSEGFRAVGVDRVVAEADVAKMTLYKHFPSKDDLILATLKQTDADVAAMFEQGIRRHLARGEDRVDAFFSALGDWFKSSRFRGCSFINATVELADPEHPASEFSAAHKQQFHDLIREIIATRAGPGAAEEIAPAVALLVEGAIVAAVMQQSSAPADVARRATSRLLAAADPR